VRAVTLSRFSVAQPRRADVILEELLELLIHEVGQGSYHLREFPAEVKSIDVGNAAFSGDRLETFLGSVPRTALEAGIKRTVEYFGRHYDLALRPRSSIRSLPGEIHEAIARVLRTGRYILASEVAAFEREFADYIGMKHGISLANATDGLTLTLLALGIKAGDEVITTPFTAITTVSAIIDAGATPVFVDVCADTFLMDVTKWPPLSLRAPRRSCLSIFSGMCSMCRACAKSRDRGFRSWRMLRNHMGARFVDDSPAAWPRRVFQLLSNKEPWRLRRWRHGRHQQSRIVRPAQTPAHVWHERQGPHCHQRVNSRLDELQAAILRVKLSTSMP